MTKAAANDSFLIWGGYGGHNLGDEAILWAMTLLLRRLRPSCKLYVMVRGALAPEVVEQYRRWQVVPVQFRSLAALRSLRKSRLVVGGGQLLDDTLSLWPVGWTSLVLITNFLSRQRPLILCIGAEVIKRKLTAIVARRTYSLATAISLRDEASLTAARQLGISPAKLLATRDVVFSLPAQLVAKRTGLARKTARIILVVAHDPQRTPGKAGFFSALAKETVSAGLQVGLVAHDLRTEYDYGLLQDLEREFEADPRVTISRPSRVDQVLQVYADAEAVISSRMHPLILASLAGSLPIAIIGTPKVNSLVDSLKLPSISRTADPAMRQTSISESLRKKDEYIAHIKKAIASFAPEVEETTARALRG